LRNVVFEQVMVGGYQHHRRFAGLAELFVKFDQLVPDRDILL
jgi:hypothetical protein